MFKIYIATSRTSKKSYVGQTCETLSKRRWAHIKREDYKTAFAYALRKYGPSDFDWQVVGEVPGKLEANNLERVWIALLRTRDRNCGYNMTAGGDGTIGFPCSTEQREKRPLEMKRRIADGTHPAPPLGSHRGHKHSEETKARLAQIGRERIRPPKPICKVPNCTKINHANGYCASHNHRFVRYGDPLAGNPFGHSGPMKGAKYNCFGRYARLNSKDQQSINFN